MDIKAPIVAAVTVSACFMTGYPHRLKHSALRWMLTKTAVPQASAHTRKTAYHDDDEDFNQPDALTRLKA